MRLLRAGLLLFASTILAAGAVAQLQDLPAQMVRDYFVVPVALHGDQDRVLWMLYDTGASITVVDPESLESVSTWQGGAGQKVNFTNIEIGPVTLTNLSARTIDLDHISAALGFPIDGILAYWSFAEYLVQLDYPQRSMRVGPGELAKADGQTVFELTRKERLRPFIRFQLAGDREEVLIDSGSGSGIVVRDRRGIPWLGKPIPLSMIMGINGPELEPTGRLDGAALICGKRFLYPTVRLTQDTELIGTQVMRHFRWTFDRNNRRVEVVPANTAEVAPHVVRTTGVLRTPTDGAHRVLRLLGNSPAELAGIQAKDLILAVNGVPFAERGTESIPSIPSTAGPVTRWTLERDGEVFNIETVQREVLPIPAGVAPAEARHSTPKDRLWTLTWSEPGGECQLWIDAELAYTWPREPKVFSIHPTGDAWAWVNPDQPNEVHVFLAESGQAQPYTGRTRSYVSSAGPYETLNVDPDGLAPDASPTFVATCHNALFAPNLGLRTSWRIGLEEIEQLDLEHGSEAVSREEIALSSQGQMLRSPLLWQVSHPGAEIVLGQAVRVPGSHSASWAPDGQSFACLQEEGEKSRVVVYDREGRRLANPMLAGRWRGLSWSSDGNWLLSRLTVGSGTELQHLLWAAPVRAGQAAEMWPIAGDGVPLQAGWLSPAPQ